MVARGWLPLVVFALASLGAQHRTKNFNVNAPREDIAKRVGEWAEYYRKQKAVQWLGKEMPDWPQPIPLTVKVTDRGSGGATSFVFDRGRILSIQMEIEGTLERLIYSVLPHEVTHTVLAHHFRQPVPRWADEGGSVLSEDDTERTRHDHLVRQILNTQGRMIPLKRLFALTQYPDDVMVLYAEGYSVTNFLVGKSSRGEFLNFVADGMRNGWDQACKTHYSFSGVNELEQAWIQHLRETRPGSTAMAKADNERKPASQSQERTVIPASRAMRQTLPPAVPTLGAPQPLARGAAPNERRARPAPAPAAPAPQAAQSRQERGARLLPPQPSGGWDTRPQGEGR